MDIVDYILIFFFGLILIFSIPIIFTGYFIIVSVILIILSSLLIYRDTYVTFFKLINLILSFIIMLLIISIIYISNKTNSIITITDSETKINTKCIKGLKFLDDEF